MAGEIPWASTIARTGSPWTETLIMSSNTLDISPETLQTAFKGQILVTNLLFVAPRAGSHIVEVRDSLNRLTATTMEISITPGDPERLGLLLQTEEALSSSYGGVNIAAYSAFADEESVPLGNFTVQPEDVGQNQVKILPSYEELFLTVIDETVQDYVSDVVELSDETAEESPSSDFAPVSAGFGGGFGEEDEERVFTLENLVELNNSVTVEVSFTNVIQYQEDHPEFVKINTTMYSVTVPVATLIGEGETVRIENTTTLYNSTRVTTKVHRVSVEATYLDAVPTQFVVADNRLSAQGTARGQDAENCRWRGHFFESRPQQACRRSLYYLLHSLRLKYHRFRHSDGDRDRFTTSPGPIQALRNEPPALHEHGLHGGRQDHFERHPSSCA